jgi:hypothetical protein
MRLKLQFAFVIVLAGQISWEATGQAVLPNRGITTPVYKGVIDYQAEFDTELQGQTFFGEYEGIYHCESSLRFDGGGTYHLYNWPATQAIPPGWFDIRTIKIPWRYVVASGPAQQPSTAPPAYLASLPTNLMIDGATLRFTETGNVFAMEATLVENLLDAEQLPTTVNLGQGDWEMNWGPMPDYFIALAGRYYLLSAEVELGDMVGCPEPGCTGGGTDADVNGDCRIDLIDLAILLSNFGITTGATHEDGDVDSDGDVELADLSVLLSRFGNDCS